ncbi:MAG: hypothetical protein U5J99_09475 [Parvularculaceae bacterium]|nr:hypothetical protein [Parvularculaceae bacterium]
MTMPAPGEDPVVATIRTNIIFEKMIVSVLTVAAISGAAHWLISAGVALAGGGSLLGAAGGGFIKAAAFTLLFFFAAFAAAVAVGVPLFLRLERLKLRKGWPYVAAAGVAGLMVAAAFGIAPSFEAPWRALYLFPGIAAALLFARAMRPFWAAAERAEAASAASSAAGAVIRLH